jgi:hypothetical protein
LSFNGKPQATMPNFNSAYGSPLNEIAPKATHSTTRPRLFRFTLQQQLALQIEAAMGHNFFALTQA